MEEDSSSLSLLAAVAAEAASNNDVIRHQSTTSGFSPVTKLSQISSEIKASPRSSKNRVTSSSGPVTSSSGPAMLVLLPVGSSAQRQQQAFPLSSPVVSASQTCSQRQQPVVELIHNGYGIKNPLLQPTVLTSTAAAANSALTVGVGAGVVAGCKAIETAAESEGGENDVIMSLGTSTGGETAAGLQQQILPVLGSLG